MAPDGSSGATVGGENIPNSDSVKKTIATYYGDPGTGIANKTASPYISEMDSIISRATSGLKAGYDKAIRLGEKPAIVFDSDDTTLMTYDMEVGCAVIGLTGRNDNQKAVTLANVGYTGFTAANYYTKRTGVGASQQPSYIKCATASCTTIEYKSQTRAHVESRSGEDYDIVANFGDLFGGPAHRTVKLPNPTYYLP
jgi:hypothetical protein